MFCTDDHIPLHHVGIFTVIFQQTVTRMSFLSYPHDTVGLQVTGRVNTRFILIIRLMLNHKVQRRPQRLNSNEIKPEMLQIMLQFTVHALNCQTFLH